MPYFGAARHLSYYGYDGHGSVRFLTNELGAITDTYDYDAFGTLLATGGTKPNRYLYTGEQYDSALGLYYLRARYMNVASGRFWNTDTYEGQNREPRSFHKFLYANVDPVNFVDPSGFAADPTDFIIDGVLVHRSIAADFIGGKIGPGLRLANYVPIGGILNRSARRTDKSDAYLLSIGDLGLKPDLVDLETREVWEIKTTRGYAIGLADLALYLSVLNSARDRNSRPWRIGASYSPPSTARGFRRTTNVYPAVKGVITYDPYISEDALEATAGAIALSLAARASAAAFASLQTSLGTAALLRR